MFEKHLWKSDILSKDAGHRPASLLKMSFFHSCFSNILLVKTNYLVSTEVEHWSKMGWITAEKNNNQRQLLVLAFMLDRKLKFKCSYVWAWGHSFMTSAKKIKNSDNPRPVFTTIQFQSDPIPLIPWMSFMALIPAPQTLHGYDVPGFSSKI